MLAYGAQGAPSAARDAHCRRVHCADGPERVFGEWWKRDAELVAVRDYFRVEDEAGETLEVTLPQSGEFASLQRGDTVHIGWGAAQASCFGGQG